ncbi:MAG: asparagine synthase (glutamine-hydrolyzing) [Candidatus Pacearchaeota archaeon]
MCGINGFNFKNAKILKKMNQVLVHRGPDSEGTFFDKNISLGHRRLAIIDLTKDGNQPMEYSHKGKKAIIVFNGEIYNFQEIREELKKKGYLFRSNSDTEVIVASYLEWENNCVNKFNGMWAFCIYDPQKEILFLSRDRFGKKPLYYYFDGKKFIFSSEIKGILEHEVKKKLSKDAVDLYFSMGFVPSPFSIYEGVFKIEAMQSLIFDIKTRELKKFYYYECPHYNPVFDKRKLITEGRELLRDAVRLRLISDVPTGAFLSGGIDSSTITSEMAIQTKRKDLQTYSIGFEGEYDETPYIHTMRDYLKVKHNHKYFKKEDFEKGLKDIFYYYDEPFADYSMFPTMTLSRFARETLTVSLSGDGGDEIFGGYPRHKMAAQMVLLQKVPKIFRKMLIFFIDKICVKNLSKLLDGLKLSLLSKEEFFSEAREEIYKPEIYKKINRKNFEKCLRLANNDLIESTILMDRYYNTLADNFLCKVDRASMGASLEVRSPFLDYRFLEYSAKIPSKWKASIFNEKILLKEIVKGLIPDKIINRKKKGFTPPVDRWILENKFIKDIEFGIKKLYEKKIISEEWKNFYEDHILKRKDLISNNYKIRMFLFWKWFNYWN